jgi:pimeloyl-ACP methyl ester carboxylesterase
MASLTGQTIDIAGFKLHLTVGGSGPAALVLPHEIGSPPDPPILSALASRFAVTMPDHPGFDRSERPAWIRSARDIAVVYQWLLADLHLTDVTLVGLGLGGWVAAEMASMAPRQFPRLVLVGAMGLLPQRGEIMDQALVNYIDYLRAGVADPAVLDRLYDSEPSTAQLEQWDINREMSFRVAWKPYMYNPTLPHLLGGIRGETLVVWGDQDRIVPLECGERYAALIPNARLEIVANCGHFVDFERPNELAAFIASQA